MIQSSLAYSLLSIRGLDYPRFLKFRRGLLPLDLSPEAPLA